MRKLKVPVLVENAELPKTMNQREFEICFDKAHYEFVPEFEFKADGLSLISSIGNDDHVSYLYAYIVGGDDRYYENALVKTEYFHFRTYAEWKKAVKAMAAQLVKRWKAWVRWLYVED